MAYAFSARVLTSVRRPSSHVVWSVNGKRVAAMIRAILSLRTSFGGSMGIGCLAGL